MSGLKNMDRLQNLQPLNVHIFEDHERILMFDTCSCRVVRINATGREIIEALEGPDPGKGIKRLERKFGRKDVHDFLSSLHTLEVNGVLPERTGVCRTRIRSHKVHKYLPSTSPRGPRIRHRKYTGPSNRDMFLCPES